jgi:hypothetical protein
MLLFPMPNEAEARKLVAEVEANGTKWSEQFPKLLWYVEEYNLYAQAPSTWFTDPSKKSN